MFDDDVVIAFHLILYAKKRKVKYNSNFVTENITFYDSKEPINTYFLISMFKQHLVFLEYHENLQERNKNIHLETTIVSYKCLFNYKLHLVRMIMTIIDYRNIF